jgi:hypothetical protein
MSPRLATTFSTTENTVSYPRGKEKAAPLPTTLLPHVSHAVGKASTLTPHVLLGSKAKAQRPEEISVSSSRPAAQLLRFPPGVSISDTPVHPPAATTSNTPIHTLHMTDMHYQTDTSYQCAHCRRISTQPDFDCGCIVEPSKLIALHNNQSTLGTGTGTEFTLTAEREHNTPGCYPLCVEVHRQLDKRGIASLFRIARIAQQDLQWQKANLSDPEWQNANPSNAPAYKLQNANNNHPLHNTPDTPGIMPDEVSSDTTYYRCGSVNCVSALHRTETATVFANRIWNAFNFGQYRILETWFSKIAQIAKSMDLQLEIDAFSSKAHSRLSNYWSSHTNAFDKFWGDVVLWLHPPLKLIPLVVDKILRDQARGVLLIPINPEAEWFQQLTYVTFQWWDLPNDTPLFEDFCGVMLPPLKEIIFRVCFFDAFGTVDHTDKFLRDKGQNDQIYQLSAVIESGGQHPKSQELCTKINREFSDVLEHPIYAHDIDPAIRGPFGVCKIELKEGAQPMHRKFFRCSGEREQALNTMIEKLIERKWIIPSKSEWTSQAFVVPKPPDASGEKKWRLVLDYRYLNSQTKDDPFPLPLIEDLITKQAENRLWSIFDLEDGFHQMHLHPDSQPYTAFVTSRGVYQWTVLPMGVKNGPAMFQRMIQWILRDLPFAMVYIDDVLIGTPPPLTNSGSDILDIHYRDIRSVLTTFKKHLLFVKGAKMHLFRETIKFCGHILNNGQRRASPSKLEAIKKWTPENIKTITHLKGFLGLAQYYAIYMKDFAKIAEPLTRQLKNRAPDNTKIQWDDTMRESLTTIKQLMLDNVVLDIADPYKPYVLEVDSSDYAVGGVLSQHNSSNELRPVAFFSRKLQGEDGKGQVKWSIREKETYAIVLILQKFRSWVASSLVQILVLTDHESLQHWYTEDLNKAMSSVGRRCRWHEFLSQFNLVVVYTPGHTQKVADPLSRAPWHYPGNPDEGDATFHGSREADEFARRADAADNLLDNFPVSRIWRRMPIAPVRGKRQRGRMPGPRRVTRSESPSPLFFREWDYSKDDFYNDVVQRLRNGELVENYTLSPLRLIFRNDTGYKYCIPCDLVDDVLLCYHNQGHPGAPKLLSLVGRRYCTTLTEKDLYKRCLQISQRCQICQAVKPRRGTPPGTMDFFPVPNDIFTSLCMDFLELEPCKGTDDKIYDYILVVVCRLSGYIVAIPFQRAGLTAHVLAQMFLE